MSRPTIEELRTLMAGEGVEDVDDLTLARIAKALETARTPQERAKLLFAALGLGDMGDEAAEQFAALAEGAASAEEFADSVFIGRCPNCGNEKTRNAEQEPGVEDLTVGLCDKCGWLWCSECGTKLTREQPECPNPACWLNQDGDDDELPDDEPEL